MGLGALADWQGEDGAASSTQPSREDNSVRKHFLLVRDAWRGCPVWGSPILEACQQGDMAFPDRCSRRQGLGLGDLGSASQFAGQELL